MSTSNTIAHNVSRFEVYCRWADDFGGPRESRETFALYLEFLVEQNHEEISIKDAANIVGKQFPEAVNADDVTSAVTAAKARKRAANMQDLAKVLNRISTDSYEDVRDRAILLLGTLGDLSGFEIANLEVQDIAFDDEEVLLVCHYYKREDREVPIANEMGLSDALQEWVDLADIASGYLFRALDSEGKPQDRGLGQSSVDHIRRVRCQAVGVDPMKVRGRPTRKSSRANFSAKEIDDLFNQWDKAEFRADKAEAKLEEMTAYCQQLEEKARMAQQAAADLFKALEANAPKIQSLA